MLARQTRELWYAACLRCGRCRLVACRCLLTADSPAASFNSDNNAEHEALSSRREFWPSQYELHLPLCRKCDVRLAEPSEYRQTYTFAVTERVTTACVVDLKWHFGHGDRFGIFDSFDVSHPPSCLKEFHTKQQQGNDVTIARTRYIAKCKPVLAVASTALVLPACLLLGFVMASLDDGKLGRPSNSQPRRKPGVTRPATPSFNDVMRKTAAIEFKLQLATMAAAKHPSDAKLQQMIARCYLELADVYSTSPVTRIRATEFRHKALEILEGVVADNPNVSRL